METRQERKVRDFFLVSVLLKGGASLFEVVAGLLAFFIPVSSITNLVVQLAQGELSEDPGDFVATHLVQLAHQFTFASNTFIAVYLLSRGVIKLGLVVALLKNKLWAYPSSLAVLGLFMLYQMYQIFVGHSVLLILLTLFDFIVMYFIWKEYTIVRERPV